MSDDAKDPEMDAAEYPPHIAALLDDARPLDVAPSTAKSSVKARVLATVASATAASVAPGPLAMASATPAASAATSSMRLWLPLALVGAVVAAVLLARRAPTARPGLETARVISVSADAAPPIASASIAAPLVVERAVAVPAPTVADSGAVVGGESLVAARRTPVEQEPADTLAAERRLLDAARDRLGARDAGAALSLLSTHAQRYARGTLSMEREALRVRALLLEDRRDEARSVAQRFVARWPSSALRPAVEAMVR